MEFPYSDEVDVLTAQRVTSKYSTGTTLSWTNPTRRRVTGVLVYSGTSVENPTTGTPYALTNDVVAILPYGDPITAEDRVEVLTGPYRGTYDVTTRPAHWRTPWSGREMGTEARLQEVTGA